MYEYDHHGIGGQDVRRRVAVEFLGKGMAMADVALVLGVSLSSVKRWKKSHREGGDEALEPKPLLGPESKLDDAQRKRLCELLLLGPLAAGFSTELWTCRRVAEVVRREFGVEYHPDHLIISGGSCKTWDSARRSLSAAPANGTKRRSRDSVRTTGRESKKSLHRGAVVVFLDESGFRLQPLNRRTWAPVGERPQVVSQRQDRLSVIGSLSVLPGTSKIRQHFAIQERNVRTPDVIRYLRRLRRKHRRPLVVVMDRLNVHRSAARQLHERGARWLDVEWLPAYAPDLNPVESLWSHAKYTNSPTSCPTISTASTTRSPKPSMKSTSELLYYRPFFKPPCLRYERLIRRAGQSSGHA